MWNCTHFRHPTDEQLQHVDIFFSNYHNLQSVYFELMLVTLILELEGFLTKQLLVLVIFKDLEVCTGRIGVILL